MNIQDLRDKQGQLERTMSCAFLEYVKEKKPNLSEEQAIETVKKYLDMPDIQNTQLVELTEGKYEYIISAVHVGYLIGKKGELIDFLIQDTKKSLDWDFELKLRESRRSELYHVVDNYYLMKKFEEQ